MKQFILNNRWQFSGGAKVKVKKTAWEEKEFDKLKVGDTFRCQGKTAKVESIQELKYDD
jgi:hypothetical protein